MSIVTSIGIYGYDRKRICDLYDSEGKIQGQAYNIDWEKNINGISTLTFTIPYYINNEPNFRWEYLRSEYLIKMVRGSETEWFIASKPAKTKSNKEIVGSVKCNGFPAILKTKNIYMVFDDENGIGTVDYIIEQILTGTGWRLGHCDTLYEEDGVTEMVRSLSSDGKKGALSLIETTCNLFKCYPVFDSENMLVNIYSLNRHEQAIEVEAGRNTETLSVTYNSEDIVTRLYVEGEYGDDGYVGIDDVNPTGLSYILNFDYYKEIGLFTDAHEAALQTYLTDALAIKTSIMDNQEDLIEYENQANNLIGQCILTLYYVNESLLIPKYTYGDPTHEQQALNIGDEIVILNSDGTHRYVTIETTVQPLLRSGDYGVAKFATKAAGSVGAKEVQIEAKEKEIANLQRKISQTTKADKIAEYEAEIAQLNTEIQTIYTESNGLYKQMQDVMKSDGILYYIDHYETIYEGLVAQQAEIEATFVVAMGNMLRDGYWQNNNYIEGQEAALFADAKLMSEQMAYPQASYTLSYFRTPEDVDIPIDDLMINDIAHTIDDELEINDILYIKKIKIRIDDESNGSIEVDNNEVTLTGLDLGSVLSRMSELSDLVEQKNALYDRAKAISSSGTFYTDRLNGQINVLKTQLMSTVSNWYTDDQGNIMFESADGGSAMMLCGAGFMIASSKDDSGNWNWRTFGTGQGFTADEIVAGFISAERIEAGSIGTEKLDPGVGDTLVISNNPSITGIEAQIELLPDQIIQYVGQQGYGRTFISSTDPALDPDNNVVAGDYWVKPNAATGNWGSVKANTWGAIKDSLWGDLLTGMAEMFVRYGSGASVSWMPVNDRSMITELYTQITQTRDAIRQEAYRASEAEGELQSQIIQSADSILQTVASGYISKTADYTTVDQIITEAQSLAEDAATSAKNASIAKTATYQTADAIVSTAVAQALSDVGDAYIAKTSTYQTADAIVTEAVTQAGTAASNSYIAKTETYQTVDSILTESQNQADAAATSAKNASIAKTQTYQTADSIYSAAVAAAATAAGNTYIAKTSSYQTADAIVNEASRLSGVAETNAKNASIARTSTYQTVANILTESQNQADAAATSAKNASIARTQTYQTADSIYSAAVAAAATSAGNTYIAKTTNYQTADAIVSTAQTYTNNKLTDYSTTTQTATEISSYVSNNAYTKVSGITINANGVTITGSKYIKLDSGYVEASGWKFSNGGLSYSVTDSYGTTTAQFRVINSASSIYELGELLINCNKMILINPTVAYNCVMTFYTYVDSSNIPHVVMGHRAVTGLADLGLSSDWFYQAYIRNVHYNNLVQESSRDVKHNIVDIHPSGSRIDKLKPVTFVYNDDDNKMMHSGLIYEDTISVFPEICREENGIKSIAYIELIPYLLKEVQELRTRVKQLEH